MLKIWVVEDNFQQRAEIREAIRSRCKADILEIATEYDFRVQLEQLESSYPDIIIIDVMLPWVKPAPNMPEPPEDVKTNSFYRAGIRCLRLARAKDETKAAKIIILTNLEQDDLKEDLDAIDRQEIYFVAKGGYSELLDLMAKP
ncbi:response regulator [Methylovulum psychrotolerans]|uniref:Response regulatory domain-containing protein n=1 Tax=Methylovulum psychrotolerans TaxID=1704499 RepID=A0A2S5CPW0_9GAMM|nr:response regulator [Methylovulum psychrotolerans]POZ52849.1 hypothetical protein AADEFJLK_01458 [Methylovulum psychrotolerans]